MPALRLRPQCAHFFPKTRAPPRPIPRFGRQLRLYRIALDVTQSLPQLFFIPQVIFPDLLPQVFSKSFTEAI
jgi:hypothetical protein